MVLFPKFRLGSYRSILSAVVAVCGTFSFAQAQYLERPPQFVALAFDGSKSLAMWQETQEFAEEMAQQGKPVRFTYFINSVYYLSDSNKTKYNAPGRGPGKSAISFGGSLADVSARYDQTNFAFVNGHEIANHAAGHFDGSGWSQANWNSEFNQFYAMIFDIFNYNGLSPSRNFPNGWSFSQNDMVGFRAPQLGNNNAMFVELPRFGMKYDTSLTAPPDHWPSKNNYGTWSFPLASIPIAGTSKKTLSMDYNFYFFHSNAKENPSQAHRYEEQMLQSYLAYFQSNYNGNRAPINIGHHFSKWNAGAYWNAMKRFAAAVCGLPEVKCVTYKELMNYLENTPAQTLAAYRKGAFEKISPIVVADATLSFGDIVRNANRANQETLLMIADPPEAHDEDTFVPSEPHPHDSHGFDF